MENDKKLAAAQVGIDAIKQDENINGMFRACLPDVMQDNIKAAFRGCLPLSREDISEIRTYESRLSAEQLADLRTLEDAGLRITEVPSTSVPSHIAGIPTMQGTLGDVIDGINQKLQVLMSMLDGNDKGEQIVAEIADRLRAYYRSTKAEPPKPTFRFCAYKGKVFMGSDEVGRFKSNTLAKRAARALNRHVPNERGV